MTTEHDHDELRGLTREELEVLAYAMQAVASVATAFANVANRAVYVTNVACHSLQDALARVRLEEVDDDEG